MEIQNLFLIIISVWGIGVIFRKLNLPVLLGELLAGLILGPALLGVFQNTVSIQILSELGIFFLMLHAGLESNPHELLNASKKSILIALGGVILPLVLGIVVAKSFGFNFLESLFIGMSLSVTAIAVTTKVFKEFKFNKSEIAHLTMSAAIIDDILAFLMLSIILGVVQKNSLFNWVDFLIIVGKVSLFFGGVIIIGQKLLPIFKKIFQEQGHKAFTFLLVIALAFGLLAEKIGLHSILGAYLAGLFVKEEITHPEVYRKLEDRLFALSYSFLGPIFFISLGFHVDFKIFQDSSMLIFLILIILAAITGKIIGAGGIAYGLRKNIHEALIIGISMNGRGAVELIIAVIGLEQGLINSQVFSVLILMAFITTLMTPISLKYALKGLKNYSNSSLPIPS
ncbi:MAG: sodium/hydrogen exchanger [Candidatus Peregrinibacteria bacterium GW2011_GWE2_39_6]|nr:MAG: sodium/hydrogen exchanger [Candidatus Peregrinibacteria bacterium GW2011_GWF2_39_17]KKR26650.1 MAG: sodium/hydrogen exchanger [Candidatus Peregrinibacteria bacterium GW2011_GWE2_39_6]HCW32238.1 hypothetical protein [Candidatus Peregrinibacteria bacterium]